MHAEACKPPPDGYTDRMLYDPSGHVLTLNQVLASFNIKANCVGYYNNDNYSYYDVCLANNSKIKDIKKYSNEISLALKAKGDPNIKILYEQGIIRLEFFLKRKESISLFDCFDEYTNDVKGSLPCLLGKDMLGNLLWMDIAKNPHMLVAGTTGSGKSTLIHNIIANLFNYNNCWLFLIDPKEIEFSDYGDFDNVKIANSYLQSLDMIESLSKIMEGRYDLLKNGLNPESLPYIVLIVDEFADLVIQDVDKKLHNKLCKLSQKCRAARISIILATQRPSVDVISGTIKANFPARISCMVSSHFDSKVILDSSGAEQLLGNGDALVKDSFRTLERFQVAYTDSKQNYNRFYAKYC